MEEKNFTPLQLQPLEKSLNIKKILVYLLLIVLVVVFVATVGMTLLVNGTLFLSNTKPSPTPVSNQSNNQLLIPPEFDTLPTATNSARLPISGRAPANQTISILMNSIQSSTSEVKDGKFESEITLSEGENVLSASYTDDATRTQKSSAPNKIIYLSTPPSLELTSPNNDDVISGSEIKIEGKTDKEVVVNINSIPVVVDSEGKFSYTFPLKNGQNNISITAKDIAGNKTEQNLSIDFASSQ